MGFELMTADEAKKFVESGKQGSIETKGLLDLRGSKIKKIKATVKCYDLDATGSNLTTLPDDIKVTSQIILDDCKKLESLPDKLKCGSLSLRNCNFLSALPEGLKTWFLDMSGCQRFHQWPRKAQIAGGSVILRNCIEIQTLPKWFKRISQLDIAGCIQLNEIPAGVTVSSWIDLGGANLTSLPDSLSNVQIRWRSVPIDETIAFHPEKLNAKMILAETNAEIRRVMIERMGYLKFAVDAGAVELDADTDPGGQRQLLRIELEGDEPLVGLACSCPSTGRKYLLRVPPDTKNCHQAAAWMAGFDNPKKYKPSIET